MIIRIIKDGAKHIRSGKPLKKHSEIGIDTSFKDVVKWVDELVEGGYAVRISKWRNQFDELEKAKLEETKKNLKEVKEKSKQSKDK